jgi:hypothetical protein
MRAALQASEARCCRAHVAFTLQRAPRAKSLPTCASVLFPLCLFFGRCLCAFSCTASPLLLLLSVCSSVGLRAAGAALACYSLQLQLLQQCTEDLRKRTAHGRRPLHLQCVMLHRIPVLKLSYRKWNVQQRTFNRPRSSRSLGSLEKSSDTLLLRGLDRPGGCASFGRKHGLGNVNVHGAMVAGGEGVTILHCTTRASRAPGGEGVIVAHVLDAADDTV